MTGSEGYANSTQHLLAELARLDVLLARQVRCAQQTQQADPTTASRPSPYPMRKPTRC